MDRGLRSVIRPAWTSNVSSIQGLYRLTFFYGPDRNGVVDACAIPSYIGCRTKSVFKTKPWKSTVALLLLISSLREYRFRLSKTPYLMRSNLTLCAVS